MMVERLILECESALKNNLYFSALSIALILPDICSKAEYPSENRVGKRYIDWYDEYIGQYQKCPVEITGDDMPYASGTLIYQLRCSMLHQGNPDVDAEKTQVDEFALITEKYSPFGMEICESFGIENDSCGNTVRAVTLNIQALCMVICETVGAYYKANKAKFDFFNYRIIDNER